MSVPLHHTPNTTSDGPSGGNRTSQLPGNAPARFTTRTTGISITRQKAGGGRSIWAGRPNGTFGKTMQCQHVDSDWQVIRLHGSVIDYAIVSLRVLYVALMVIFAVLVFSGSIDPVGAGFLGLAACALVLSWILLKRKRQRFTSGEH